MKVLIPVLVLGTASLMASVVALVPDPEPEREVYVGEWDGAFEPFTVATAEDIAKAKACSKPGQGMVNPLYVHKFGRCPDDPGTVTYYYDDSPAETALPKMPVGLREMEEKVSGYGKPRVYTAPDGDCDLIRAYPDTCDEFRTAHRHIDPRDPNEDRP